jgi:hypothetical protein
MAYAVSPAAAELRPYFDATGNWKHISCSQLSLCDDVSAGWFVWAFREAVQGAGYDKSGSTAREFYLRFSREIDAACDAGRLKCRAKSLSLAPAIRISDAPGVMRFAFEALWHAAAYDQFVLGGLPPLSATGVSVRRDYENVTGAAGIQSFVYQGWLLHKKGAYVYVDSPSTDDFSTFEAFPSPDIRQAFGKSPEFADADLDHARFTITTSCTAGCVIVVENGSAGTARIPLSPATVDDRAAGANYHLDTQFTDPPTFVWTDLKVAGQTQIATFYQQVIRWWFVLVVLAAAVRVVRAVRGKRSTRVMRTYTLVGCTAATMLANCGVLGLVSAVSFYALFPEYETSLFPLLLMCIVMTTAIEGEILIRLLRRRSRPRVPRLSSSSPSL